MKKLLCLALIPLLFCTICTALAEEGSSQEPAPCSHSYDGGTVTAAPTCGQAGVKTYICTLCGDTKTETIPATGNHSWNGGSVTTAATCQSEGIRTHTCSVCGGTKTEAVPIDPNAHSYGAWDGGQAGSHTRTCGCGATQSAPHSFDVTATVPATCKEEGATAYGCSTCGRIEYEIIPKLTTHTYDNDCDAECNACGFLRDASHKYGTVWSKDGMRHWHACSKCGAKTDEGKHVPGPAATEEKAQLCLTCGYVLTSRLKHTHTYETEYTSDETGHWYACTGCEERKDFEEHSFDNGCDPDCNVCGYVTETAHAPDAQWNSDETGHWHLCTSCGEFFQFGGHIPGEDGQCSVCGFAAAPTEETHTHAGDGDWCRDETFHWEHCQCGEVIGMAAHVWDENDRVCTACGWEKPAEPVEPAKDFGVMPIVLAGLLILAAGACVVLILILRKKPGKYSR